MKTLNKIIGAAVIVCGLLSSCSKENESLTVQSGADDVISKKGLLLEGSQEVPAKNTGASGTMDVSYNKTTKVLTYTITWKALTGNPVGSHIHGVAPRGMNAPVVHPFTDLIPKTSAGTFTNTVAVDEVAIKEKELLMGLYYLNIHTPNNPGGEIRGQIEFENCDVVSKKGLLLEGSQEVPAKTTKACGTMDVTYNKTTKILTYSITWNSLSGIPVGSHIHGEAPRGVNAPVVHPFTDLIPKTTSGSFTNWVLVDEVAIKQTGLLNGQYYLNIHTMLNPGGEIRGQIEFK
jgi:Cu/Zn superoxide dismutase